ncbi:MAG: hypothetical protein ACPGUV_10090, partial [Polyangiales bacterium]
MPSQLHDSIVDLFRRAPTLLFELLRGRNPPQPHPTGPIEVTDGDLSKARSIERRADLLLHRQGPDGTRFSDILEVQLIPPTRKKHRRWAGYVTEVHDRFDTDVTSLTIITVNRAIARACAHPLHFGPPGVTWPPYVLGPDELPWATAAQAERMPELGVLCAIAHGDDPHVMQLIRETASPLLRLDEDIFSQYAEAIHSHLGCNWDGFRGSI